MFLNHRIIAVMKREIKAQVMTKMFIITTLLFPALFIGIGLLNVFVMSYKDDRQNHIQVISSAQENLDLLKIGILSESDIDTATLKLTYKQMPVADVENYLMTIKPNLLSEKITGVIVFNDSSLHSKELNYYSSNPNNLDLFNQIRGAVNKMMITAHFQGRDVSQKDIEFARKRVSFEPFRISEESKVEAEGYGNLIMAGILTFLLYMSLLIFGMQTMRAVTEEKSNKVVEVLLSSVSATELMTGKIIGSALTGLLQMAVWIVPPSLVLSLGFFVLPAEVNFSFNFGLLLYVFYNYVIGIVTYLSLFAMVGAIFDTEQEAQQGVLPIMMTLMIPFYIFFSMINNPQNLMVEVASMLPFFSIMLMPARIAMISVPGWQILVAIVVNLTTLYIILNVVGKIYRIGIMSTGKRPSIKELISWLKTSA